MQNQTQVSNDSTINSHDDGGIDITHATEFFIECWKTIVGGAFVGGVIVFVGWYVFVPYQAESILVNNEATYSRGEILNSSNNFSFIAWRGLQKNLPALASDIIEKNNLPANTSTQYRKLAQSSWWQKNVRPTYFLTKADARDMAVISKALQESGGNEILNLVVTASGSSKELAKENVAMTTEFIKSGSAYLSIKGLVKGFESRLLNADPELKKKILNAEVELNYMRERARNLETLRNEFPDNSTSNNQVVDLKDSSAKYLPISIQLIAVKTQINEINESLQRMQAQLIQTKVLREFVENASSSVDRNMNGIALADELLKITFAIRSMYPLDNTSALQTTNDIESSLINIQTFFNKSLAVELSPQITKSSFIFPLISGFFGGGFFMLFYMLMLKMMRKFKSSISTLSQKSGPF